MLNFSEKLGRRHFLDQVRSSEQNVQILLGIIAVIYFVEFPRGWYRGSTLVGNAMVTLCPLRAKPSQTPV